MRPIAASLFLTCLSLACGQDPRQPSYAVPELTFTTHFDGRFHLPEGWASTLWAESPMLYNPTNIDVDAKGRLWVAEAVNYRDYNNPPGTFRHAPRGDRIVILEDTDHDGRADSSRVFVQDEDLVAPLGIAVFGKRVVVSCSPHLIVYTDHDGDDRPDDKEVLLTGFGGYDHDHSLHAVVGGPDGHWYTNTGNAGPHTVTDRSGWTLRSGSIYTGGSPYNTENQGRRRSDDGRVWVGGLALRLAPDGTGLKVMAHNFRNAYELAVDSYGNLWQNDNDDQVETCRATWIMPRGNAGYFNAEGTSTWQADRRPGQSMFRAHWHQDDPGVMPAGDNTGAGSPTGVLVYEGEAFGPEFRGMFLSADAGRNVIFAYQPKPEGAGFALHRRELISSVGASTEGYVWNRMPQDRRKYMRPSDIVVGTDGALYLADWYDAVVGGHQMRDTAAYGRIYRIAPEGSPTVPPAYDLTTLEGAVAALRSPADHVRYQAAEALAGYGAAALPAGRELLRSPDPFLAARALWVLARLGEAGLDLVAETLARGADPRLRVTAFRALADRRPGRLAEWVATAADDPSPQVRREAAIALHELPEKAALDLAQKLWLGYDGSDRWYLEALGTGLAGRESAFYRQCILPLEHDPTAWDPATARLTWRLHPPEATAALRARALDSSLTLSLRLEALSGLAFIESEEAAKAMQAIAGDTGDRRVATMADWWLDHRATGAWFGLVDRSPAPRGTPPPVEEEMRPTAAGASVDLASVRSARPDAARGRSLFARHCLACHRIDGEGSDVGPRLKHIRTKLDRESLAHAIVHPNAAITFGYEPVRVDLRDGGSLSGFLLSEGEVLVIKDLAGRKHALRKEEIAGQEVMDRSLMPSAAALGLDAQDVADVTAYLLGLR